MACLHLVVLEMEKKGRKGRCASMSWADLKHKALRESENTLISKMG